MASLLKSAIIITIIPPIIFARLLITPVTTLTNIVAPSLFWENSVHSGSQAPSSDKRNCDGQLLLGRSKLQSLKLEMFCNCAHWLLHTPFLSALHSSWDGMRVTYSQERYVALQKNALATLAQAGLEDVISNIADRLDSAEF